MTTNYLKKSTVLAIALCFGLASAAGAQSAAAPTTPTAPAAAAAAAAPSPLGSPAIQGPLSGLPPAMFNAGPFGQLAVNGVFSALGEWQGHHVAGDANALGTLSNDQIIIQKANGVFQFYLQAGGYTMPALASPFLSTDKTVADFYGPLPVAYVKLALGANTSIMAGALPTMIGAEYTFSFENMNIERGLLWNQENAITRGVQVNQTMGKFTGSLSWGDGFYSNRYTWLTGELAYASGANALAVIAGGNLGQTAYQTLATPVQNNSRIVNVIYTFTKGPWMVQPYYQYTDVPTNAAVGVVSGASTQGGAVLLSRSLWDGFSLAGRGEYIKSSGSAAAQSVNLMFGPGSSGWSFTVTPTYQDGGFFLRGEVSFVHAVNFTAGDGFGVAGTDPNQARAVAEIGFIFGNNITK